MSAFKLETRAPDRGRDAWGCGDFGASRGSRAHKGVDLLVARGSEVLSPAAGTVTKLGYPYGDDLSYRYVQITDVQGLHVRLFYVAPTVSVGDVIERGDVIGLAQDLGKRYKGMPNHVHVEIMDKNGHVSDPAGYEHVE